MVSNRLDKITLTRKDKLQHLLIWIVLSIVGEWINPAPGHGLARFIISVSLSVKDVTSYYYMLLFVLPKFYEKGYFKLVFFIVIGVVSYYIIYVTITYFITNHLEGETRLNKLPFYAFIPGCAYSFFIFAAPAFGTYLSRLKRHQLQIQFEKEKLLAEQELLFLKNQFNSHLTFNFLGYCHASILRLQESTAEAIELFSDILRYSMKAKPEVTVLLAEELEQVDNYIQLQKWMVPGASVNLSIEGEVAQRRILPCTLTNLLEMTFCRQIEEQSLSPIAIQLDCRSDKIYFYLQQGKCAPVVSNIAFEEEERDLRKSLDLFYQNKYELQMKEDKAQRSCQLILTA